MLRSTTFPPTLGLSVFLFSEFKFENFINHIEKRFGAEPKGIF
jgi:hypothetical protein